MIKLQPTQYPDDDVRRIAAADRFALAAHVGQKRKSGKPYISHPRAVAQYLADLNLDADTIIAALLHDTVEDTSVKPEEIGRQFGPDVQELVEGVTKLGQVHYAQSETTGHRHAASVENVRKLLLAMSKDLRVLMVKLADRRHNLQTLKYLKPEDRQRIARESLDVYAPLADRLNMGVLKAELEDMAFEFADPAGYRLVKRLVASNTQEATRYINELREDVSKLLAKNRVDAVSVHGRQKHLYSVYRKLAKTEGDISKIYDLMALRVIVETVSDCYQVLGILHQQYKPLIYRIKDYIAVPKPNGYRSLHTTVFAKHGKIIEIQIRTVEMHREAEQGLAAHTLYSLHKTSKGYKRGKPAEIKKKLSWIQELAGLSAQAESGPELLDHLKIDLFRDRIFVFSPMGDLYDLPEGATPIDFAFAIHSDIGLRVQGARVNGRIAPLDRPLDNRDVVEIITRKQAAPNRAWLNFVKTAGARSKIKAWFRASSRDVNIGTGRQMIEAQLGTWNLKKFEDIGDGPIRQACDTLNLRDADSLLAGVGEGSLSLSSAIRRLLPAQMENDHAPDILPVRKTLKPAGGTGRMFVIGAPELPCYPARCCEPKAPQSLVGYITRGSGVTVHRADCPNVPNEPDRLLECQWESATPVQTSLVVRLRLICRNRLGLVHDLTGLIVKNKINIDNITTKQDDADRQRSIIDIVVEVPDMFSLNSVMQALRAQPDTYSVVRLSQPPAKIMSVPAKRRPTAQPEHK